MAFAAKKARILQLLALPDDSYTDASPKGSVDAAIRPLIDQINAADGLVTTSSCAGRVAVFLEGRRTTDSDPDPDPDPESSDQGSGIAGVGGKGGGEWLYVSHEKAKGDGTGGWVDGLGLEEADPAIAPTRRLIHYKFEPMILHVLTASPAHAQMLLRAALAAGFRESGAVSIAGGAATPVVAVRSAGLALESLIGYEDGGRRVRVVGREYLRMLEGISEERFAENTKRIERFSTALRQELDKSRRGEGEWEDREERRARMRAEGLRRKALQAE